MSQDADTLIGELRKREHAVQHYQVDPTLLVTEKVDPFASRHALGRRYTHWRTSEAGTCRSAPSPPYPR